MTPVRATREHPHSRIADPEPRPRFRPRVGPDDPSCSAEFEVGWPGLAQPDGPGTPTGKGRLTASLTRWPAAQSGRPPPQTGPPRWLAADIAGFPDSIRPRSLRAFTRRGLPVGAVVTGRAPHRPGEATVSHYVADALHLRPGDRVTVATTATTSTTSASGDSKANVDGTITVVGVTISPANRSDTTVGLLATRLPGQPTGWLTITSPWTEPDLRRLFDDRRLLGRTTGLLATDEAHGAVPASLAALRFLFPAAALLSACLLAVAVGSQRDSRARDVSALAAAGLDRRRGWRLLLTAAWVTLTSGAALGAVVAVAGLWLARSAVSAVFAQDWQTVAVPAADVAVAVVAVPMTACAFAWLVARDDVVTGRLGAAPTSWRLALGLLAGGGAT